MSYPERGIHEIGPRWPLLPAHCHRITPAPWSCDTNRKQAGGGTACGESVGLWGMHNGCWHSWGQGSASGAHKQKATRGGKFITPGKLRLCRVAKANEVWGAQAALRPGGDGGARRRREEGPSPQSPATHHIPPRLELSHPAWASRNEEDQCPRAHVYKDEAPSQTEHHCLPPPTAGRWLGNAGPPHIPVTQDGRVPESFGSLVSKARVWWSVCACHPSRSRGWGGRWISVSSRPAWSTHSESA